MEAFRHETRGRPAPVAITNKPFWRVRSHRCAGQKADSAGMSAMA